MFKAIEDEPTYTYVGDMVKRVMFGETKVSDILLTSNPTSNHNILLINIYINGERKHGVRYEKNKFNYYVIDKLILSYCMQEKMKDENN